MHTSLAKAWLWGVLASASGCLTHARVNGEWMARESPEYQGQPYSIRHKRAHPQPGGPSSGLSGYGGTIQGEVCGAHVYYAVEHQGESVQLLGQIDGTIPADLRAREQLGGVNVAGRIGQEQIDLQLFNDRLVVAIDDRVHAFQQRDDELNSSLYIRRATGTTPPPTATFDGLSALAQMPAAVQAALLPLMVHCMVATVYKNFGAEMPPLGFGGQVTHLPHGTLLLR